MLALYKLVAKDEVWPAFLQPIGTSPQYNNRLTQSRKEKTTLAFLCVFVSLRLCVESERVDSRRRALSRRGSISD
jgi:hypothetical protein